ncbi:hypothetical protein [uncultured Sphingomonas sp.]|uniref:energy transducer TonB n=1 Tax=uncultured Sphingomonas sp. TaxID=158754 RepID=UPI002599D4C6|nr:hypothetical protein [uncultured Sphingomonas sp.]
MTIILVAAIAAAVQSAASAPPAPPVPLRGEWLLDWVASPVLCKEGGPQAPARAAEPRRTTVYYSGNRLSLTIDFRIDAAGRPLSITRRNEDFIPDADDLAPALAAARFVPGQERRGCVLTFTPDLIPVSSAPLGDVMATFMTPRSNPPRSLWDRIHAGGDCGDPAPAALLRAFPDFKRLPDQPGYHSWTMIGFDLSPGGKPRRVRTIGGDGASALDTAGRAAVARSRFEKGAHTGCTYGYFKGPAILPAPAPPMEEDWRPAAATCPKDHVWDRAPRFAYPPNYQARSIEGWAIVTYDVAPWGEIGNVHAKVAEPTADFGTAAENMLRAATFRPGPGYVGCTERVRYRMGRSGEHGEAVLLTGTDRLPTPD